MQELERLGAEVLPLSADVTDEAQMQTVAESVERVFGEIHGIFHTAGIPGGGIIQLKTLEMADQVMAPKVTGTLVLKQIFVPLDFLVLFSSISSTLGGAGQVDYCAANAFLDSLARSSPVAASASASPKSPDTSNNYRTISINWDVWQQVGMGANMANLPEALKQQRVETLKTGITPNEGVDALNRILSSGLDRVIVSTKDWQRVLNQQDEVAAIEQSNVVPAASVSQSISSTVSAKGE